MKWIKNNVVSYARLEEVYLLTETITDPEAELTHCTTSLTRGFNKKRQQRQQEKEEKVGNGDRKAGELRRSNKTERGERDSSNH